MGNGAWNSSTYSARTAAKRAAGVDQFAYDQVQRSVPVDQRKVHETLDPKLVAGPASPHAGQVMRECMISDEHPDPTPIIVVFDQTGSMGTIPRTLQQKLGSLHGLLVRKGYASDPQIMFGAIGDARNRERVPLQIGQFESDNRMDENLENLYLEGNGGGQMHETYELAIYFAARHTYLETYEKHGRKGYCFLIGDERTYPTISRANVKDLIGDDLPEDLDTKAVLAELSEKYHVYYVFAKEGTYTVDEILGPPDASQTPASSVRPNQWRRGLAENSYTWRQLLGERAIELDDADAVCEVIAGVVGLLEGVVTLDDADADFADVGASVAVREAAGKALASVGAGASVIATSSGELPGLNEERE